MTNGLKDNRLGRSFIRTELGNGVVSLLLGQFNEVVFSKICHHIVQENFGRLEVRFQKMEDVSVKDGGKKGGGGENWRRK